MNALLQAIASKISGSALSDAVNGRIYLDQYPDDEQPATFPYIIYFIVSSVPERTFTEYLSNILIQFSIFSTASSASEIANIYALLKALFDECSLTISGSTLVWMKEENLTTMTENIEASDASISCRHWTVDFEIKTSLN